MTCSVSLDVGYISDVPIGTSQHRTVRKMAHLLGVPLKWYGTFRERNLLSLPGTEPLFPSLLSMPGTEPLFPSLSSRSLVTTLSYLASYSTSGQNKISILTILLKTYNVAYVERCIRNGVSCSSLNYSQTLVPLTANALQVLLSLRTLGKK